MLLPLVLSVLVSHAVPTAVDCETGVTVDTVPATEPLCASGTAEAPCGARLFVVEAAAPGLVDVRPTGATPVAGTFAQTQLAEPPLASGTFDFVVDVDCDGTRSAADTVVEAAVEVLAEAVSTGVDAAASRARWQELGAALDALAGRWPQHQTSLLLGETTDPVWVLPGGNPAVLLLWTPDGVSEVALPPEAQALLGCGDALASVLALPSDGLAVNDGNRSVDMSEVLALGYPFASVEDDQDLRSCAFLASGLAETTPLLLGLLASLDALEAEESNTPALRLTREAQTRANTLSEVLSDLRRGVTQQLARVNAVSAARAPWRSDALAALAERVATEGWSPDEQALLALHRLDEDATTDRLLETAASDGTRSHEDALLLLQDVLSSAGEEADRLQAELEALATAHAPWAIDHDPTASLDGPYFGRVGRTLALSAQAASPRGDGLALRWDLDADGIVGDAEGGAAAWTPAVPARSLLRVEATDQRGVTVEAFATLEVEASQAPSTWVEVGPEDVLVARPAGEPLSFLALATAGTGAPLRYTFSLDGTEQATVEPPTAEAPAYWDWLPDPNVVGLHHVRVVAHDPSGDRADRAAHWSVHITEPLGGDDEPEPDPEPDDTGTGTAAAPPQGESDPAGGCGGGRALGVLGLAFLALVGPGLRRRR